MGIAKSHSVALEGTHGTVVEVEVNVTRGTSKTAIIGLRDTVLSECRDRVRAATFNSGQRWPDGNVTIGLAPAWIRKEGSAFDLAVAVAALAADGQIEKERLAGLVLLAEICLDGRLRPIRGVLPSVVAGRSAGLTQVMVAEPNQAEASQVPGLEVYGMRSLAQVIAVLRGEEIPDAEPLAIEMEGVVGGGAEPARRQLDLADVLGQYEARQALEVSAAGGHHLLLAGAPGAGKTLLAERLPGILPTLDEEAALEVSMVHSVAGTLSRSRPLITDPPYQSVHHTCTVAAMVGGGSGRVVPGVISRAHRGVLFIDEIAEVQRSVLEALREPLESGEVVIARSSGQVRFPARFLLAAAMNPCPCGSAGIAGGNCGCTPNARRLYTSKLSGPLLDRIDLRIAVQPLGRAELFGGTGSGESSAAVRERVEAARERAGARYEGTPWKTNAEIPGSYLRSTWAPDADALVDAEKRFQSGSLTARGFDRLVRTAWTLADLSGRDRPGPDEMGVALAFRQGLPGQLAA